MKRRVLMQYTDSFKLKLLLLCAIFTLSLCGALRLSGQTLYRPTPTTDYGYKMDCRPVKGCVVKYDRWYRLKQRFRANYKDYTRRRTYARHARMISKLRRD